VDRPRLGARTLAIRVVLLAVTVGAIAAGAAAFDGAGACSSAIVGRGGGDAECFHLVRMLAERLGLFVAAATAVLTLTAIGLNRLVVAPDRPPPRPPGL